MAMTATTVTTGEVRFTYPHLFAPDEHDKYSVTVLLPKGDTQTKALIDKAVEEAKRIGTSTKWGGVCPPVVPTPIHDGDGTRQDGTPFPPECKGHWVMSARSNNKPEVVDGAGQPIMLASDVYSGCYGRVNFNAYAYMFQGKKGIAFGLGPVQKLRDGESLAGGAVSAAQAFGFTTDSQGFVNGVQGAQGAVDPITGLPM